MAYSRQSESEPDVGGQPPATETYPRETRLNLHLAYPQVEIGSIPREEGIAEKAR
jgi:hypothetical protein